MKDKKELSTLEEIKALSDPYRIQIMNCLKRQGHPMNVKEIAIKMGEVPAKIHYHVKKLESAGIIHLVATKSINGITAKYYEPTARQFVLSHREVGDPISKILEKETEKLVNELFNSNRNMVIQQMRNEDEKDAICHLSSKQMYLTEEEAKEFMDFIIKFHSQHNSSKKGDGKKEYVLFSSFFEVINNTFNTKLE